MDENKAKNAVVKKEKRKNELEILFSFELGKWLSHLPNNSKYRNK